MPCCWEKSRRRQLTEAIGVSLRVRDDPCFDIQDSQRLTERATGKDLENFLPWRLAW